MHQQHAFRSLNAERILAPDRAKAALEKMDGITYELMRDEEIPPMDGAPPRTLYVIRMARRHGAKVTVLRWYYVLDGVVFEAPSLQAALSARVQRLGWHLSKAFEGLRAAGLKAKEATSKRASRATSRATSRGSSPPPEAESRPRASRNSVARKTECGEATAQQQSAA